jgi:hypothetical protein
MRALTMTNAKDTPPIMSPDIVITRDRAGYHLLHGLLHLAMAIALSDTGRTHVHVKGHGFIQVARAGAGFAVHAEDSVQPLLIY